MTTEIEKKLFEKYKCPGIARYRCSFGADYEDRCICCHIEGCGKCNHHTLLETEYPKITADKILGMIDMINRYYIVTIEKFSASTRLTAHLIPDENLMVDEAYFMRSIQEDTLNQAICKLQTEIYEDLTEADRNEVKKLVEKQNENPG
jgi:hypothetical protein